MKKCYCATITTKVFFMVDEKTSKENKRREAVYYGRDELGLSTTEDDVKVELATEDHITNTGWDKECYVYGADNDTTLGDALLMNKEV